MKSFSMGLLYHMRGMRPAGFCYNARMEKNKPPLLLAPLRGVTIRCFRAVFADAIEAAGFVEAVTPFVSANAGVDPLKDRELRGEPGPFRVTPQFIGKDPAALRACLARAKEAGFATADLNAGCPYPMVRNKGRGSGLLRTPAVLEAMVAAGCDVMGPGNFSVKTRLGVERDDELARLMPLFEAYPLRFLAVHARTAREMYGGSCRWDAYRRLAAAARVPLVPNGDLDGATPPWDGAFDAAPFVMVGRPFVRALGLRADARERIVRYCEASRRELSGDRPVLGRMKELLSYWKDLPPWRRRWPVLKLARTLDEFVRAL